MNTGSKWQRNYRLVIFEPIDITNTGINPVLIKNKTYQALTIESPITLQFSIGRGQNIGVGQLSATIYNLGLKTREKIFHDPWDTQTAVRIQLFIGYGQKLTLAFDGYIRSAMSYRSRSEVLTEITAYESDPLNPFISLSLAPGTTLEEAVSEVIDKYMVFEEKGYIEASELTFERGLVMHGSAGYVLKSLTKGKAQNDRGVINVLGDKEAFEADVPLINASTGLMETPKRFNALLEASITM